MKTTGAVLLCALLACGCIKRTAVSSGPRAEAQGSSAALEAKNARIAHLPRVDLLGTAGLAAFKLQGEDARKVTLGTIAVTDMPFGEALRLALDGETDREWAVQLAAPTAAPVEEGDAILVTFYLRTEVPQQGGVGETQLVFELARAPYTKSVQYPVQSGSEWAKVQVRFQAVGSYAAGAAHTIFRLGYTPQVIHLGGVKVESFGKRVPLAALPATTASDRRRERELAAVARAPIRELEGGPLDFEVAPGEVIRAISPYVYGLSSQPLADSGATVRRAGGNRQTAYNWEIDASNAGKDWEHASDLWACTSLGLTSCGEPAGQYVGFARANNAAGIASVVTVPLVDWVAADHAGPVSERERAPSKRWRRSLARKPGPFSALPDTTDEVVYQDEMVSFLVRQLGSAKAGGIAFYSLDNEPALWPSTHPRVHPEPTRYDEVVRRTEAVASALTAVDPDALTVGGNMFGWAELMSLREAPDHQAHNAKYGSYTDYFLASMKSLEERHHRRLLHVLDVHWYPEARGSKRITELDLSPWTVEARLQAPRSLWDPTYVERSWIAAQRGGPIRLIPWLRERIAERYPGTKLAITEYDYGAGDHVSGGLAQADVLGVLGREGVFLANYWGAGPGNGPLPPYIRAAFQLFRNYDGHRGAFGDTAVIATVADQGKASIFAATDTRQPGRLTIVVINKDLQAIFDASVAIRGGGYAKAQVFTLDGAAAEVRAAGTVAVENDRLAYRLPPLSASLFVCTR